MNNKRYWLCTKSENGGFTDGYIYTTDKDGFDFLTDKNDLIITINILDIKNTEFKEVFIKNDFSTPTILDLDSISLNIMDLACKAYSSAIDKSEKEYVMATFLSIRKGLSKIEKFITKDNSEED